MKKWIIPKGFHISNFIPKLKWLNYGDTLTQTYTIMFDDSCRYAIDEKSCVNKLFGHCFGLLDVHKNSVRFGWTYNKKYDKIIIWAYIYKDGKLIKTEIGLCVIGDVEYKFTIKTIKNSSETIFYINDEEVYRGYVIIYSRIIPTLGFYFGGKTRAPHKMFVNYKKEN